MPSPSQCFAAFAASLPAELLAQVTGNMKTSLGQAQKKQADMVKKIGAYQAMKGALEESRAALKAQRDAMRAAFDSLPFAQFWYCMEVRQFETQMQSEILDLDAEIAQLDEQINAVQKMIDVFTPVQNAVTKKASALQQWIGNLGG